MQMVSVVFFAIFIFVTCIYSDKLGRKTVLISTTLATLVFSLFAMQSLQHNVLTVMLFLCVGFALMGGLFGPCGAYLPELFPTHVRYSGAGLSYNLAAITRRRVRPGHLHRHWSSRPAPSSPSAGTSP